MLRADRVERDRSGKLLHADFGDRSQDLVDRLVIDPDEAFFDQVMPGEFLLHAAAPLCIIRSKDFLARVSLCGSRLDLSRTSPGVTAVQEAAPRDEGD